MPRDDGRLAAARAQWRHLRRLNDADARRDKIEDVWHHTKDALTLLPNDNVVRLAAGGSIEKVPVA